ncbi:MAG: DUF3617 family protein, partial [Comamonas sp.]
MEKLTGFAVAAVVACAGLMGCSKKEEAPSSPPAAAAPAPAPAAAAPAPAPAAAAQKVQPGKWQATTEMSGPMGQQALAGMEQAFKTMTPEQKKAANLDNAKVEGGKLVQEMCITPEMAGKNLQSLADSQLKNMPGCSPADIKTEGNKESMRFTCGEGKMSMVLEAVYTSPTENT